MTDNEKRFIKSIFSGDSSGHDYYHTIRVYKLATKIAKQENADVKTVQLSISRNSLAGCPGSI